MGMKLRFSAKLQGNKLTLWDDRSCKSIELCGAEVVQLARLLQRFEQKIDAIEIQAEQVDPAYVKRVERGLIY
jgi:hypothetical protein